MESYRVIISGKVQHVYYRKFVSQALQRMGVQGYIRNLSDGTVEVVARIYDDVLENAMEILWKGSPLSSVENIERYILDEDDIVYDGFVIRS
jgi:acylphosphatase